MSTENEPVIARQFSSDKEITEWLADQRKMDQLKLSYPPEEYRASMDLEKRQVIVTKR